MSAEAYIQYKSDSQPKNFYFHKAQLAYEQKIEKEKQEKVKI